MFESGSFYYSPNGDLSNSRQRRAAFDDPYTWRQVCGVSSYKVLITPILEKKYFGVILKILIVIDFRSVLKRFI